MESRRRALAGTSQLRHTNVGLVLVRRKGDYADEYDEEASRAYSVVVSVQSQDRVRQRMSASQNEGRMAAAVVKYGRRKRSHAGGHTMAQ